MRRKVFYRWLVVFCIGLLALHYVDGKLVNAIEDDSEAEESVESSSAPAFVRSRFNLRVWSTTEVAVAKNDSVVVETAEAAKEARPTKSTLKPKRTRSTTTRTTTTTTTTESSGGSVDTTTPIPDEEAVELAPSTTPKPRKLSPPSCGELNGDDVPWIAVLEHTDPSGASGNKKTLSKGVLIDDRHVLTTISSIHNSYPFWVVTRVRLGDIPTWASADAGRQMITKKRGVLSVAVKNVFLHERKDIAVIRLAERVNITSSVRPVCLPTSDRFNYTELHFHVCRKERQGQFGRTNSTSKLVAVTSLTQKDCQILFRRHQAELSQKEFCAWDETGDNCTGDLGGPLMAKLQGRYHVTGLNSYALAKSKIDSEGLPGVYVRVGSFLKWIQAVLRTEFNDGGE